MSRRAVPRPGVLVLSLIYRSEERFTEALEAVCSELGPARNIGESVPFDWTRYYEREMGKPLYRRFVVLEGTRSREFLPDAKIVAEQIENRLSEGENRTVNIDPGLLTEENLILATGKNYTHRIYLRDGVFADLTLVFRGGVYEPLPWTYPDYASDLVREFFRGIRRAVRGRSGNRGAT